jgi:hypothetical protein
MANILPLDAQKKIWSMYRARFLIAASLVSLALSALAALALVPSYLALQLAAPPVSDAISHANANTPEDIATVSRAQALIAALGPVLSATTSPASVILDALGQRPAGVTVTGITYTTNPSLITFAGSASRDAISAYRDTLAKDPLFTSVSIPVDSLIGNNSNFTMSLSGNF